MRRFLVVLAFVASPVVAYGQSGATIFPSQPAPDAVAQTFRGFGRPFGAWLIAALDSIPAAQYGFRPTPLQQSIGHIAQHLENANYQLCATIGNRKYVMSAKDSLADSIKATWPKDTLVARVRASLIYCGDVITGLNDANLADPMVIEQSGAMITVVRVRYLILLVTDLAEHYSQLATYMRIMGLVPPSALSAAPSR
jgi:hypothetical protein